MSGVAKQQGATFWEGVKKFMTPDTNWDNEINGLTYLLEQAL